MTAEVLQHSRPEQGGVFVDCTVGLGGHARALLEAGASRVIGLDRDLDALARAPRDAGAVARSRRAGPRRLPQRSTRCSTAARSPHVDGALADLGVSSMQFDEPGRGFSFHARRAARHAHGPQRAGNGGRPGRAVERARSRRRDLPVRRGAVLAAHRARAGRSAARSAGRHDRHGWPRSSAARFRIAAGTSASIRRRGRFRRCASGSTASSTGWIASSRPPSGGCAPARGWS